MYQYIVNPLTGRKVSIFGKLGKKIIKNYLVQLGGSDNRKKINNELEILRRIMERKRGYKESKRSKKNTSKKKKKL